MARKRRDFTASQKAEVVRRHLAKREPVSKLAEELQVQPSQIHQWVNHALSQLEKAFDRDRSGKRQEAEERKQGRQVEQLQAKLALKNEVIAELMEANVQAKKANGEL